jgi:hypothetical protein
MSQTRINDLPEEIMLRIFDLLPPQDLKSVMMVSKAWAEMGENPTLWTWSLVSLNTREDFHKLNINRLQLIRQLEIGDAHCLVWLGHQCQWTDQDWITDQDYTLVHVPLGSSH